jgi:GR25 family glycosyltransferase involved in LPS biosynthesis
MNIAAYILTTTSIDERLSDAKTLQHSLNSEQFFKTVEVVPAIYWKEENSATDFLCEFPEHTFTERYLDVCRKGQICCTLSHIKIWRKLLNSDHDGAFVFEDDIYLEDPEHLKEVIDALSNHKEIDWLRVHLHKSFREEILQSQADSIFMGDPSIYGFAAYYVSRQGAKKTPEPLSVHR